MARQRLGLRQPSAAFSPRACDAKRQRAAAVQNLAELSGGLSETSRRLMERSAAVSQTSRSNQRCSEALETANLLRLALWAQPRSASAQQTLRLRQGFIQLACIFAAAAGVVGFAAAFAADDGRDGLDDFAGLNARGVFRGYRGDERDRTP